MREHKSPMQVVALGIFYRRLSEVLLLLEHFACTTFFAVIVPLVAKVRLGRHACNGGMASARSVKFTPTVGCLPSIGAVTCARGEGGKLPQTIMLFNIWTVCSWFSFDDSTPFLLLQRDDFDLMEL